MRTGATARYSRLVFAMICVLLLSACQSLISIGPSATPTSLPPTESPPTVTPEPLPTEPPAPTEAPAVEPTAVVVTVQCTVKAVRGLRLRGGPGTEYQIVTTLEANEALTASGRSTEADWVAVRTGAGQDGWVSSEFVECGGAIPGLPEATPAAPPPAP